MVWRVELSHSARKALDELPATTKARILVFMRDRVAPSTDPKELGRAMGGAWRGHVRYRVGDYRIICRVEKSTVTITAVKIGHRRQIYDR